MKLTVTYEADADAIGEIIANLPTPELRKLADMVDLLPELFPAMTRVLVETEAKGRS